jgi:hypothetical protein
MYVLPEDNQFCAPRNQGDIKSLSVNNIHLRRDTPEADDGCGEHVECDE